jgi:ATP-dependent RNA helicase RhlE
MTFHELGLSEPLLRTVAAEGYSTPTPIQAQSIPHAIAGRDLLGCAQTGTGKTAAFALPILHRLMDAGMPRRHGRKIRVLVLSPTRELAAQIGDSVRTYGGNTPLRHTVIFGGVGQYPQTRALQQGVDILIATPGRLCDLMNQGYVDLRSVEMFVLDEADRMLDMGFLPDVKRIIAALPQQRQTLFFSATMPGPIEELANAILRDPVRVRIAPHKPTVELIEQSVLNVPTTHKARVLSHLLCDRDVTRAIVFTRTKHGADRVVRQLGKSGIRAEAIHGNKSQTLRIRTLANFKSSRIRVLVATDIAARGIDVDDISHVINYDLPYEPETYVHRIGRTGRAGAAGKAVSFCDNSERPLLKAIERLIRRPIPMERVPHLESAPPAAVPFDEPDAVEQAAPISGETHRDEAPRRPYSPRRHENRRPNRHRRDVQQGHRHGAGDGSNQRPAAQQGRRRSRHRRRKMAATGG